MGKAKAAERPEDDEGEDADVHAGDDEDVVSTGALVVGAGVAIDERLFADHHGVKQSGFARRPELVNLGDNSAVETAAPGGDAAAIETWEWFDGIGFRRGEGGDPPIGEIGLIVEGSGIAEVVRESEFGVEADAVAVAEFVLGIGGGVSWSSVVWARGIDAEVDARMDVDGLSRVGLELFGFNVERLTSLARASLLDQSVAGDVGGDLSFLSCGVGLDGCVEVR